jgi:hypothetical protein
VRRAVDVEHRAAGQLGLGRGEIDDRGRHLLGRGDPPERALGLAPRALLARQRLGGHLGVGEPGRDAGHRDPARPERARQRLAERDDARLARAVGGHRGLAAERAARGDVDDPPAAAHVAHGAPAHVRRADEVDRQHLLPGAAPVLVGGLVDRVRRDDPRVVDEHVDRAERLRRAVDHRPHRDRVGEVGAGEHVPVPRQLGQQRLGALARGAVVDRDAVAQGRERPCRRGPDPT